jgi:hypothetical protein
MKGKMANADAFVKNPEFNAWLFPIVPSSSLIKLPPVNDKEHSAYPLQLNPNIYKALFSVFCKKDAGVLHIYANVCTSFLAAEELECKLACWESNLPMCTAGIKYVASTLANDQLSLNVVSFFIY